MIDVALDARITPRMSAGMRAYVRALVDGLPRVARDVALHVLDRGGNFGIDEQVRLPIAIREIAPDVTHFPTVFVPLDRRPPYVAMVHDLIHLQLPQFFSVATAAHYALVAGPMFRNAALLLASDARTVAACERYLHVPPERCRIVPLGYDPALLAPVEPLDVPRPFLFYAGNHRPHKNLAVLFEAWSGLLPAVELDLVCTGPDDPAVRDRFARAGGGTLRFAGDLPRRELARYYRAALAYVHPALVEGFGLPMLEATALGTPVLASETCVPGILARYATAFAPHDVLALRALIVDVVARSGAYRRLAAEGSVAVRAYTWDRFAAATAAVYREVAHATDRS
jgi:glycosyltransferase involved in cell wall biosynthesis